jgi:hypothetical protein
MRLNDRSFAVGSDREADLIVSQLLGHDPSQALVPSARNGGAATPGHTLATSPGRQIQFENSLVVVPSGTMTGQALKRLLGVPQDRDLVRSAGSSLEMVADDSIVSIADGDGFMSLPNWRYGGRLLS